MDLNLKKFPEELKARISKAAEEEGLTIKEWMIEAAEEKLNPPKGEAAKSVGEKKNSKAGPVKVDKRVEFDPEKIQAALVEGSTDGKPIDQREPVKGFKCECCGAPVVEFMNAETRVVKWKCTGVSMHTMTPRVKKEVSDAEMTW